jgi:hypothetical protein
VTPASPRGAAPALLYLAAPAALFLLLFLRLTIGVPVLALLVLAMWHVLRTERIERRGWLPAVAGGLIVGVITGFPHGPYPWDWVKHWALMGELSSHSWPLSVELNGENRFLRYYVGAYLVPALVKRVIPQIPLWAAAALWFSVGFVLVLRMVTSISTGPLSRWLAVLLILVLGGADFFGDYGYRLLYGYQTPLLPLLGVHHETWAFTVTKMPLEYSSFITALAWVPHQAIATFLVAGLMSGAAAERRLSAVLLGFGLLALWSPYGMIGLLPLVGVTALQHRGEALKPWTLFVGASAAAFALLVAGYLATDLPAAGACFACFPARLARFADFVPFLLVELLPFALILGRRMFTDALVGTASATLLVIPLMYGEVGDFVMRASLGPLFVLGLAAARTVIADWAAARRRLVHAVAVLLCAPGAISEMVYLRTAGAAHFVFVPVDPLRAAWMTDFVYGEQFTAKEFLDRCGWRYLPQYFTPKEPGLFEPQAARSP